MKTRDSAKRNRDYNGNKGVPVEEKQFHACMKKMKYGEKAALREVYEAYIGYIYSIVFQVVQNKEIPETELKYQAESGNVGVENGEWLNLKIRYKAPDSDESRLCSYPVTEDAYMEQPGEDFYFAAAVAEFGLLVRDSEYKKDASFENVRELLKLVDTESDEYKDEFVYLVKKLERNS